MFLEWLFTVVFTIEYIFRIIISRKPAKYILSFYGIIDLISIVPTYFSLVLNGSQYLLTIRILRMLRIFRILKLTRFMSASQILDTSIRQSSYKILVFFRGAYYHCDYYGIGILLRVLRMVSRAYSPEFNGQLLH